MKVRNKNFKNFYHKRELTNNDNKQQQQYDRILLKINKTCKHKEETIRNNNKNKKMHNNKLKQE